jgi:hypothetical protein
MNKLLSLLRHKQASIPPTLLKTPTQMLHLSRSLAKDKDILKPGQVQKHRTTTKP